MGDELKVLTAEERIRYEKQLEVYKLRQAEKFIVRETGLFTCKSCTYTFDPKQQGRSFDDIPSTWKCPVCGAPKSQFAAQTITIAGFEVNQGYGLGSNSMTEGQKS